MNRHLPVSPDVTLCARYEGTLSYIDAENSCVTLDNVKSWGTEGRASRKDEQASLTGWNEFRCLWKLGGGVGCYIFVSNCYPELQCSSWLVLEILKCRVRCIE